MILNIISSREGGGAEFLVRQLNRLYSKKGVESHALYLTGNNNGLESNESALGVNPRSPFNILRIRKALVHFRNKSKGELIVHVHLTWPFFYVPLASFGLRGIKLVYTEHSTINKRRKIPLFWVLERFCYSRYSKIICISKGVRSSLTIWLGERLSERMVIVLNGSSIYNLANRSSVKGRKIRLISVGSLTPKKNFVTILHAISQLPDLVETYFLVGDGPEKSRLYNVIQGEQIQDKVKLIGWSDSIEEYFHKADIQIIPSLWEGFGLVAVEGMSTGLPVVASNVAGLNEVLDLSNPAVTFVDNPKNVVNWVESITVAIEKLRSDGAEELAIASRAQAEKFTLEKMADRYIEVYHSI